MRNSAHLLPIEGIGRDNGIDSPSPRCNRRNATPASILAAALNGGVFISPWSMTSGLSHVSATLFTRQIIPKLLCPRQPCLTFPARLAPPHTVASRTRRVSRRDGTEAEPNWREGVEHLAPIRSLEQHVQRHFLAPPPFEHLKKEYENSEYHGLPPFIASHAFTPRIRMSMEKVTENLRHNVFFGRSSSIRILEEANFPFFVARLPLLDFGFGCPVGALADESHRARLRRHAPALATRRILHPVPPVVHFAHDRIIAQSTPLVSGASRAGPNHQNSEAPIAYLSYFLSVAVFPRYYINLLYQ